MATKASESPSMLVMSLGLPSSGFDTELPPPALTTD